MAFPNHLLTPSTWRHIGLGTTALIFSLGAWAIIDPSAASKSLGIPDVTTNEGQAINAKGMAFLGIRDVAAAGALFWFHYEKNQKAMGVLLTMWTLVCGVDTWIAAQGPKGFDGGIVGLCVGAAWIAFVGLGQYQS